MSPKVMLETTVRGQRNTNSSVARGSSRLSGLSGTDSESNEMYFRVFFGRIGAAVLIDLFLADRKPWNSLACGWYDMLIMYPRPPGVCAICRSVYKPWYRVMVPRDST